MAKKWDDLLFDKRLVQKHIKKGLTTAKDFEEFLKSIPDEAKNASYIKAYEEETEADLTFSSVEAVRG